MYNNVQFTMTHQEISEVRIMFHNKKIWSMDERDFIEAGKKMVALGISEKCHSVGQFNISRQIKNKAKFYHGEMISQSKSSI